MTVPEGHRFYRVYESTWGYDEHNPGLGDARFSPIDDPVSGRRLSSMYLAETEDAALLETLFHDVHQLAGDRYVYAGSLREHLLAYLALPADAVLGDLRDERLAEWGVARGAVVSSPEQHYPCTRRLALAAMRQVDPPLQGLLWHSRQAELAAGEPVEVAVLYGGRFPAKRGSWTRFGPGSDNLYAGPGRLRVDQVAGRLDATVVPD